MAQFSLVTVWRLQAPLEQVWQAIHEVESWPRWWPFVAVVKQIEAGDEDGLVGHPHTRTP